jgi:uncharacterized protein with von Willebrand factor type A (vWA) domain
MASAGSAEKQFDWRESGERQQEEAFIQKQHFSLISRLFRRYVVGSTFKTTPTVDGVKRGKNWQFFHSGTEQEKNRRRRRRARRRRAQARGARVARRGAARSAAAGGGTAVATHRSHFRVRHFALVMSFDDDPVGSGRLPSRCRGVRRAVAAPTAQ